MKKNSNSFSRFFRWVSHQATDHVTAGIHVLHVGCVFEHPDDMIEHHCYRCDHLPDNGAPVQITIDADEIYRPRACCFNDHTYEGTAQAVITFKGVCVINERRYAGVYYVGGSKQTRMLEMLGDPVVPPDVCFEGARRDTRDVVQHVLLRWYATMLLDQMYQHRAQGPGNHLVLRWYRAWVLLKVLRGVCRAFAFDSDICRATRGIDVEFHRSYGPGVAAAIDQWPRTSTLPARLALCPAHATHTLAGLVDLLCIAIDTRAIHPDANFVVSVAIANYHNAPQMTSKCLVYRFKARLQPLTHVMARVEKLARLFEYCGHGFDGQRYTLVSMVRQAANMRHTGARDKLRALKSLLHTGVVADDVQFYPDGMIGLPPSPKRHKVIEL